MSDSRRDAARPLQFENRTASVPVRVSSDSPLMERPTRRLTLISARHTAYPSERGIVRHALEVWFSGRRPRRRGADMPSPLQTRWKDVLTERWVADDPLRRLRRDTRYPYVGSWELRIWSWSWSLESIKPYDSALIRRMISVVE